MSHHYQEGFSPQSAFGPLSAFSTPRAPVPNHPAPSSPPKALFASTTSRHWQGEIIELRSGQLRSWWHDLDDALISIEEGNAAGLEEAVRGLSVLRDQLDDMVRSVNGSAHSDRAAG